MYMIIKGIFCRLAVVCAVLFSLPVQAQDDRPAALPKAPAGSAIATFGAGCFWCAEQAFDAVPGVIFTTSGYMGGRIKNPTYKQVSTGGTGHNEVVQVVYDPAKVSYAQLLDAFWHNVDPTVADRQFCDAGTPYRSAIFAVAIVQHDLGAERRGAFALGSRGWHRPVPVAQVFMRLPTASY